MFMFIRFSVPCSCGHSYKQNPTGFLRNGPSAAKSREAEVQEEAQDTEPVVGPNGRAVRKRRPPAALQEFVDYAPKIDGPVAMSHQRGAATAAGTKKGSSLPSSARQPHVPPSKRQREDQEDMEEVWQHQKDQEDDEDMDEEEVARLLGTLRHHSSNGAPSDSHNQEALHQNGTQPPTQRTSTYGRSYSCNGTGLIAGSLSTHELPLLEGAPLVVPAALVSRHFPAAAKSCCTSTGPHNRCTAFCIRMVYICDKQYMPSAQERVELTQHPETQQVRQSSLKFNATCHMRCTVPLGSSARVLLLFPDTLYMASCMLHTSYDGVCLF